MNMTYKPLSKSWTWAIPNGKMMVISTSKLWLARPGPNIYVFSMSEFWYQKIKSFLGFFEVRFTKLFVQLFRRLFHIILRTLFFIVISMSLLHHFRSKEDKTAVCLIKFESTTGSEIDDDGWWWPQIPQWVVIKFIDGN